MSSYISTIMVLICISIVCITLDTAYGTYQDGYNEYQTYPSTFDPEKCYDDIKEFCIRATPSNCAQMAILKYHEDNTSFPAEHVRKYIQQVVYNNITSYPIRTKEDFCGTSGSNTGLFKMEDSFYKEYNNIYGPNQECIEALSVFNDVKHENIVPFALTKISLQGWGDEEDPKNIFKKRVVNNYLQEIANAVFINGRQQLPADFCNEYSMNQKYNFTNYNNYNDVPKIEYNVD